MCASFRFLPTRAVSSHRVASQRVVTNPPAAVAAAWIFAAVFEREAFPGDGHLAHEGGLNNIHGPPPMAWVASVV